MSEYLEEEPERERDVRSKLKRESRATGGLGGHCACIGALYRAGEDWGPRVEGTH